MSVSLPDPLLAVRTAQTNTSSGPYGQCLQFDFSHDIGPSQFILSYGVALSGWCMDYDTNSIDWAEKLGELGINFVPNLGSGSVLYVTANPYMSDYDGDAAGFGSPPTLIQATAVALIGSQANGGFVGNTYAIEDAQTGPVYDIGDNPIWGGWLSGFMLDSQDPGDVRSIALAATLNGPTDQQFTLSSVATTTDVVTTGSIDAFVLSYPYPEPPTDADQPANFQIVPAAITWDSVNGKQGMTGSFSASFSPPSGMTITNWGILQQKVQLDYTDDELQLVAAQYCGSFPTNPPDGNTVEGSFVVNIMNPDATHHDSIKSSSYAQISIIAQFGLEG
jgi:hypothetical protein